MLAICPKLRTFKLFVTESLAELGAILHSLGHTLDQISLVFPAEAASLTGFQVMERTRTINFTFIYFGKSAKLFAVLPCQARLTQKSANLQLSLPSIK